MSEAHTRFCSCWHIPLTLIRSLTSVLSAKYSRLGSLQTLPQNHQFSLFRSGASECSCCASSSGGLQAQFKSRLKASAPKLVGLCISAALYCAAFHEAKRLVKRLVRGRRCGEAARNLREPIPRPLDARIVPHFTCITCHHLAVNLELDNCLS